ncbi:hypothetical protein ABF87_10560 [Nitrosomonas sp. JL21]|nr:hypothetical protein [Nitrosomonas sp. JL21]
MHSKSTVMCSPEVIGVDSLRWIIEAKCLPSPNGSASKPRKYASGWPMKKACHRLMKPEFRLPKICQHDWKNSLNNKKMHLKSDGLNWKKSGRF